MRYREHRETSFRAKSVVLTVRDELAFSSVLREFYPTVRFECANVQCGQLSGDGEVSLL